MVERKAIDLFRVTPKSKVNLAAFDPDWMGGEEMQKLGNRIARQRALELLEKERGVLAEAQGKLYASDMYAVLMILQGMAGAGIDEVVKHVMTGVNPQGCQVKTFVKHSAEELDHDFLWRYNRALPERGRIGIFNGSYYDEIISVRANPDLWANQKLPQLSSQISEIHSGNENTGTSIHKAFWKDRYKSINDFESHLIRNGIVILKIQLNISKEEQKKRMLELIDNPVQWWRFSSSAVEQQKSWQRYIEAFEEVISATSTAIAPWYVIPANHSWVANAMVADLLTDVILALGVDYPHLSEEKLRDLDQARKKLMGNG